MHLQFGEKKEGRAYRDRPAAFAVTEKDGLIAVVAITVRSGEAPVFDLPGGGIDAGETEIQAMVREYGEEAGLAIEAGPLLTRANQFYVSPTGQAVNNHGAFYEGRLLGEAPDLKVEDDHELVWMEPDAFLKRARHDAQAWAVCVWLRRRG